MASLIAAMSLSGAQSATSSAPLPTLRVSYADYHPDLPLPTDFPVLNVYDVKMADPEHVELLRQGVELWNRRPVGRRIGRNPIRRRPPGNFENADLRGIDLAGADLEDANLAGARIDNTNLKNALLCNAQLQEARLHGAKLGGANLQHADLTRASLSWADLSGANATKATFYDANLQRANLSCSRLIEANLRKATLERATLSEADLSGAHLESARLVLADLRDAVLRRATFDCADLTHALLEGADLRGAVCCKAIMAGARLCGREITPGGGISAVESAPHWGPTHAAGKPEFQLSVNAHDITRWALGETVLQRTGAANLFKADLSGCDLREADFSRANLSEALLCEANLRRANLSGADLRDADLSGTDLTRADLRAANLTGASLSGAEFNEAEIGWTVFAALDLSTCKSLATVRHSGPSSIGIDTLQYSEGKLDDEFLVGAGLPQLLIDYQRSLVTQAIEFYSCFISYSSGDQLFARRLHADLQRNGVRCWFAPKDLRIGDRFRERIDQSIKLYDKLLLVLSENSINSDWVETEAETALEEEKQRGQSAENAKAAVLFPIRLDDSVLTTPMAWASHIRRTRHIGDFSRWKDPIAYERAFLRLLRDLSPGG